MKSILCGQQEEVGVRFFPSFGKIWQEEAGISHHFGALELESDYMMKRNLYIYIWQCKEHLFKIKNLKASWNLELLDLAVTPDSLVEHCTHALFFLKYTHLCKNWVTLL